MGSHKRAFRGARRKSLNELRGERYQRTWQDAIPRTVYVGSVAARGTERFEGSARRVRRGSAAWKRETYFSLKGAGILQISNDLKTVRLLDTAPEMKDTNYTIRASGMRRTATRS